VVLPAGVGVIGGNLMDGVSLTQVLNKARFALSSSPILERCTKGQLVPFLHDIPCIKKFEHRRARLPLGNLE